MPTRRVTALAVSPDGKRIACSDPGPPGVPRRSGRRVAAAGPGPGPGRGRDRPRRSPRGDGLVSCSAAAASSRRWAGRPEARRGGKRCGSGGSSAARGDGRGQPGRADDRRVIVRPHVGGRCDHRGQANCSPSTARGIDGAFAADRVQPGRAAPGDRDRRAGPGWCRCGSWPADRRSGGSRPGWVRRDPAGRLPGRHPGSSPPGRTMR